MQLCVQEGFPPLFPTDPPIIGIMSLADRMRMSGCMMCGVLNVKIASPPIYPVFAISLVRDDVLVVLA